MSNSSQAAVQAEPEDEAGGARSERRAAVATRIEIAALKMAVDRGIDDLTVEEIALAAGVSRRTFYRYFPTVDHALCALLHRSVARLSANLLARPKSENIFRALLEVARTVSPPAEEVEIQKLAHRVAQRSPGAWSRAVNNAEVGAAQGMEPVVTARLAATGEDPSRGPLITALWLGVFNVLGRSNLERGEFGPEPEVLEAALRDLSEYLHASLCE